MNIFYLLCINVGLAILNVIWGYWGLVALNLATAVLCVIADQVYNKEPQ